MTKRARFTTWIRLAVVAGLTTSVGIALGSGSGNAALDFDSNGSEPGGQIGELTRFEIDGDPIPGSSSNGTPGPGVAGDWGTDSASFAYGPQPIGSDPAAPPPQGIGSTGILPLVFDGAYADDFPVVSPAPNPQYPSIDPVNEFCGAGEDDNWEGGVKVQSLINIDNPLLGPGGTINLGCGQTLDKGNLFRAYAAYEVVSIPNVYGDPLSGSQNHTVLYGAWERGEVPGELNFYIPVADAVPGNSAGDRLIAFDYNSSSPAAFRVLSWNGTSWVVASSGSATDSGVFQAVVGFADGSPFPANGRPSFGEFALDLTAAGVLPDTDDGACVALTTAGYIFTETGNSANAQLKDYVAAPRLPIGNCGSFDVVKAGPAGAGPVDFDYRVEQQDSLAIFPISSVPVTPEGTVDPTTSTVNQVNNIFSIGETDTYVDAYAQPDYLAFEEPFSLSGGPPPALPTGWEMISVDCTYIDQFTAPFEPVTTTIWNSVDGRISGTYMQVQSAAFLSLIGYEGFVPSCTITNDAAGVIVEKAGAPDGTFGFTLDPLVGDDQTSDIDVGSSAFFAFDPGTVVTITEDAVVGADPSWNVDSIECFNEGETDPFIAGDTGTGSVTVTSQDTTNTVRCVFTNTQNGRIVVRKLADPATETFDFSISGGPSTVADITGIGDGGSGDSGDIIPGTYTITEVAPTADPAWVLTGVVCNDVAQTVTAGSVTVDVDPGQIVDCTFTNQQRGAIVIDKVVAGAEGDSTFSFSGDVTGSITTSNGVTAPGDELASDVAPGAYTVTEETGLTPGYTLQSVECDDDDSIRAGDSAEIAVAAGETVSCTFTNARNQATLTLLKSWDEFVTIDEAVDLTAGVIAGAAPTGSIASRATEDGGGTGGSTYSASNTMTIYSGQTIQIDETFVVGGDAVNYITDLSCTGGVTLENVGPDERIATFDTGDDPQDVTCTFLNERKRAGVRLQKVWDDPAAATEDGITATLTASIVADPVTVTDSAVSTAPDVPTVANQAFIDVSAGDVVSLSEVISADSWYTTTFECVVEGDPDVPVPGEFVTYTPNDREGTLTIDESLAGETITCAFENTRIPVQLTVEKTWVDAVGGDTVSVATSGATNDVGFSSAAGIAGDVEVGETDVDPSAPVTVFAGEVLTFSESFTSGDPAAYDTVLSCVGAADTDVTDEVLTVDPSDTAITCTYTNTRRTAEVVVVKDVRPAVDDGSFDVTIDGAPALVGATAGVTTSDPVTVFVGDTVELAETSGGPALVNYTTTLVCDNGVREVGALTGSVSRGDSFVVPATLADGATITCTFVNTRHEATLTVTKDWGSSPPVDDEVDLTISGGLATPVAGNSVNDVAGVADTDATSTVFGGETIGVSEAYAAGFDPVNYDVSLVCVDEAGTLLDSAALLSGDVVVPADPTDITCTFTNERKSALVSLRKQWVSGQTGDVAGLTVSGESGQTPAQASSTVAGPATFIDDVNRATLTVYAGETVLLGEDLGAAGSKYSSVLAAGASVGTCLNASSSAIGSGRSWSLDIVAADQDAAIVCTFVNVRNEATLTVTKDWGSSPAVDDEVDLTISGGLATPVPGNSVNDVAGAADTDATSTVYGGETIGVAEAYAAGFDPVNYDVSLICVDEAGTLLDSAALLSGDVEVPDDPTDITCTFTNERKSTTLTLAKAWVLAAVGDEVTVSIDGIDADGPVTVTAPATTPTASVTVYAGETVTLSEAIDPLNALFYSVTGFECDGGTLDWSGDPFDTDATLAVAVADVAGPIGCTITNTGSSVTFDKSFNTAPVRNSDGTWSLSYLLSVSNAVAAGQGVYDLGDSFNFGAGVSIVADSVAVANTVPGDIVTNPAFDGVLEPGIVTGAVIVSGATHEYVVTVDVTIAVGPATDGDCIQVDGEGTGFLNEMTITVDGGSPETTGVCDGFALLTLVKDLVNDDGGNAVVGDFTLSASADSTTVFEGTSGVGSALPAGTYGLAENDVAGYTTDGFACGDADPGSSVTLADGDDVTCTITNDDEPVDLELTKDDGGAEAIAGGDPFTYTITVANIGTRDADLGEPVTVTDELPVGLVWVTFPDTCTRDGQTLTCDVDPASLSVGADPVVIVATVEAPTDSASGAYVNQAWVTTQDDPVCVGEACSPPPCDQIGGNNNVDCEDTPVDREGAIEIVKTDDVADGVAVQPGDTYSYELVVTNIGVSSILPGLVVDDDLPVEIGLVSVVGGAGWSCNAVDPVECTYAPSLAPSASAPAITVTVLVADGAAGTTITNIATVNAAVDRDCPAAPEALIEAFVPACNQVTDDDDEITPLLADADLAIVKTATVPSAGAGGVFDWVLDVTNNGPGVAVNVVVGDLVPNQVTVTAVSSSQLACGFVGNDVTCTKASMAVGESGQVTISVVVPEEAVDGTAINVGTIEADTRDPDLTNNTDDAQVVIVGQVPPTSPPASTIPKTGTDSTGPAIRIGLLLVTLGGATLLATRRRHTSPT